MDVLQGGFEGLHRGGLFPLCAAGRVWGGAVGCDKNHLDAAGWVESGCAVVG